MCDRKGITCNKAALEIGLSNATPTKWKKTGATPSGDTLDKIANYFGTTLDFLTGRDDDPVNEEAPTELIKVDYSGGRPAVSARELHEFLEVETPYHKWFPRMCEYGFTENQDFAVMDIFVHHSQGGPQSKKDAAITIDMAKEICMLQRNEKGKIARRYFLQLERDWNSPEKVMARALQIADKKIKSLEADNSRLTVANQIMQPKADYFDDCMDRNLCTSFTETAKVLGFPPRKFVQTLIDHKYIFRDKRGRLMPYEAKNNGLFVVKETLNEKTGWVGTQTLITPKGRETFRLLVL